MDHLARTKLLLGDGVDKLRQKTVAVFGLGGVGGHVVEALARTGVGHIILVDHDIISITNINRQLLATNSTVGMSKVAAAAQRVRDIDPTIEITGNGMLLRPGYGPPLRLFQNRLCGGCHRYGHRKADFDPGGKGCRCSHYQFYGYG